MTEDRSWMFDFRDPENAKHFSNPRAEMMPEDYAPIRDWREDAYYEADLGPEETGEEFDEDD